MISVYRKDTVSQLVDMFTSLFQQSSRQFDIFVMEDGPVPLDVDAYLAALLETSAVKYLGRRAANKGLACSLNELLQIILPLGYEYIARMDADDICVPDRIEQQLQFMTGHADVDVVGGWIEEFNVETGGTKLVKYAESHDDIRRFFRKRCPMAHMTTLFRRTFFAKTGPYRTDTVLNEDMALWIEGFRSGCRFHNLQRPLVKVRVSNAFYGRRSGLTKSCDDVKWKFRATGELSLGTMGYVYALGTFLIVQSPSPVKRLLYNLLR